MMEFERNEELNRDETEQAVAAATDGIDRLKAKYGKVYRIKVEIKPDDDTVEEHELYFTKPKTVSYDRYVKTLSKSPVKASYVFAADNVVEEQRDLLELMLEEYPAMAINIADKLLSMLGLGEANLTRL